MIYLQGASRNRTLKDSQEREAEGTRIFLLFMPPFPAHLLQNLLLDYRKCAKIEDLVGIYWNIYPCDISENYVEFALICYNVAETQCGLHHPPIILF